MHRFEKDVILEYTFIDFFCGAGGFTEGFRQQGFKPIRGIEMWQQAINTHNLNFGLNDKVKNVLDFENDDEIEMLEDSYILLGSPPCVSFSMANKAGKADKSLGIRLIEAYLRVVAVKKHKKGSKLIAWYMENVPNSRNFVKEEYTFKDLNLSTWAQKNNIKEDDIALKVRNNGDIFNSSDYGSPQKRERFICGEFIKTSEFLKPTKTHNSNTMLKLKDIRNYIPTPIEGESNKIVIDPNYPNLKLPMKELTDHFYDTGLYKIEWEKAKRAKVNHPFMGNMSFPENENNPSRTIMATRAGSTRESIIFKSEYNRKGNGEYRLPTIREAATLMGFPFVFNFTGSESTKWKQIGNAVCPHMSFALAQALKEKLEIQGKRPKDINFSSLIENNHAKNLNHYGFNNLNTYKEIEFQKEPKRSTGSKFRRHFFKGGNMTVSLMNHSPIDKTVIPGIEWYVYVFLGSGSKFQSIEIPRYTYKKVEEFIICKLPQIYHPFLNEAKDLCANIPTSNILQKLYEENNTSPNSIDLEKFFLKGEVLIQKYRCDDLICQTILKEKENIPLFQILSLYLICLYRDNIKI